MIFIYIFKKSYKIWQSYRLSKTRREQAIQVLQDNNVENLRKSIKLLTEAEYWPKNITVTQWGEYWKNRYQVNDGFDEFIKTLSSCFYNTAEEHNADDLSFKLLMLIKGKNKL